MRGYFGIGVENISKPKNLGNLFRTAHGFGASFVFVINPAFSQREAALADTARTPENVPLMEFAGIKTFTLPRGCRLVGIELVEDAVELPVFRHPRQAAYILGPERGTLSPAMLERCDSVVRIPTGFCLNVATAGAIVMYDRLISLGAFGRRPLVTGGKSEAPPPHVFGRPRRRGKGGNIADH